MSRLRLLRTMTTQSFWLPAWIAGSYMIREFSKHITAVTATIRDTNANNNQRLKIG